MEVGEEKKVFYLKQALYWLNQALRGWYNCINGYFLKNNFESCLFELTFYIKGAHGEFLIVCLYVDDLIFTGSCSSMNENFKKAMMGEFGMADMGLLHYLLGF